VAVEKSGATKNELEHDVLENIFETIWDAKLDWNEWTSEDDTRPTLDVIKTGVMLLLIREFDTAGFGNGRCIAKRIVAVANHPIFQDPVSMMESMRRVFPKCEENIDPFGSGRIIAVYVEWYVGALMVNARSFLKMPSNDDSELTNVLNAYAWLTMLYDEVGSQAKYPYDKAALEEKHKKYIRTRRGDVLGNERAQRLLVNALVRSRMRS